MHDHEDIDCCHHHNTLANLLFAVFGNAFLAIVEFVCWAVFGSVTVGMAALHDAGDTVSSLLTYGLEKRSRTWKPWSSIAVLINSAIVSGSSIWILVQSALHITHPVSVHVSSLWVLSLFSLIVNCALAMRLDRGKSINEKVASLHFWEDVLSAIAMFLVWGLSGLMDAQLLDAIFATAIALFMLVLAIQRSARVVLKMRS